MSAAEWNLVAQAAGIAAAAAILIAVASLRFTREAVLATAAGIAVILGVYATVTGMHNELMGTAATRTRWVDDAQGRAKCVADASDQAWLPLIRAAQARLHAGDRYAVVGPAQVDLACLQLQLLPALGGYPQDPRAHLLISMGTVPEEYRDLPRQVVAPGALLVRR